MPADYKPDWYKTSFDTDYEHIYSYTDDTAAREVTYILRYLRLEPNSSKRVKTVLDVGCGWGRHAVRLARRGYQVTGVDLSDVMLQHGLEVAREQGVAAVLDDEPDALTQAKTSSEAPLHFVQGDMREFAFTAQFDFAINIFTSFGYFPTERENQRVLDGIFEALRPGGQLLIDVDNPLQYVKRGLGTTYVPVTDEKGEGHEVSKEQDFDTDRARRIVRYRFADIKRDPIYLECALYDRETLGEALENAGFEVSDRAWGGFDGMKYKADASPRLIMIGRRPA